MEKYKIATVCVSGATAVAIDLKPIPRGITGAVVEFLYDDDIWAGLRKKVAFRGSGEVEEICDSDTVIFPTEVAQQKNKRVTVGVTGVSEDGTIVIPTLWAELGTVADSAYGNYPTPGEPVPPIWAQILTMIGDLDNLDTEARENLVAAINEAMRKGGKGAGGFYTPEVTEPEVGVMQMSFIPSAADMPSLDPVMITLPEGKQGPPGGIGPEGHQGPRGETGPQGPKGDTGAAGKDGYTPQKGVDYFDGADGKDGQDGSSGEDGYSPAASVEQTASGAVITITDKSGTTSATVKNGKDGKDGADGYTPVKGTDYFDGKDGKDGQDGSPGKDGTSPVVSVSAITGGHRITITDANGTKTVDVMNGSNATVTEDSIKSALGYTPANVNDVFDYTENPTFTNIFDTVEIEYGKMLGSDGSVSDTAVALCVTGYIPIKQGQTVRMKDFALYNGGSCGVCLYGADYSFKTRAPYNVFEEGNYYVGDSVQDEDGNFVQFTVLQPGSVGFIRICTNTATIGNNPVLTVDEEIAYEMGYGEKLNPNVKVDFTQIVNAPQKNCWSILPHERLNIAYSAIGRKPVNTVAHFTDAAENYGYNALKADVRLTSDGELVCCHDAGFTFDSNGKITTYDSNNATVIHDVTAAIVLGYSFPTGEHPCLVGDYLDVCRKYGKVAFITIRNEYMDAVIPKLLEELRVHNMTHSSIINCMTYESLVQWRQQDQTVMINYTLNAGVAIDKAQIDRAIGLGYCSLCGFGLTSSATTPNHACDFDYARENGIRLLQAIAYKEGSPEDCYAMGYDGCQIGIPWNPKTSGESADTYSRSEIDAIMGSYITVINSLVGGDS